MPGFACEYLCFLCACIICSGDLYVCVLHVCVCMCCTHRCVRVCMCVWMSPVCMCGVRVCVCAWVCCMCVYVSCVYVWCTCVCVCAWVCCVCVSARGCLLDAGRSVKRVDITWIVWADALPEFTFAWRGQTYIIFFRQTTSTVSVTGTNFTRQNQTEPDQTGRRERPLHYHSRFRLVKTKPLTACLHQNTRYTMWICLFLQWFYFRANYTKWRI